MDKVKANKPYTYFLGLVIKDRLDRLGWSQKFLADRVNIQEANLSRIIRGKYSPSVDIMMVIFHALGLSDIPVPTHLIQLSQLDVPSPLIPFEFEDDDIHNDISVNTLLDDQDV